MPVELHNDLQAADVRSSAGSDRTRLLTGLPVHEQRLELAGVSTSVLVGGEGPPLV